MGDDGLTFPLETWKAGTSSCWRPQISEDRAGSDAQALEEVLDFLIAHLGFLSCLPKSTHTKTSRMFEPKRVFQIPLWDLL